MNDDKIVVQEVIKIGAIPNNMIYWTKPFEDPWTVEVSVGLAPYEIEVDFG